MKSPKISVIMPAYNTPEKYFKSAIDSILKQTYKNLELIVVDDGSTSDTIKKVCKKTHDKRLFYINHGHNGAGEARNIGIKYSTGDYLYIMASDDYIDNDTFSTCIKLLNKYQSDIVLFNLYGQENDNNITVYENLIPFTITNPGDTTQIVKKELVINNDIKYENFKSCNDLTFTYTILACAKKVVKINKTFYHYNQNVPNQISSNRGNKSINVIYAFDALKRNLIKINKYKQYKNMFLNCFKGCLGYEVRQITDENYKKFIYSVIKEKYYNLYKKIFKYKYKIIGKQRLGSKRIVYFCGIRLFSYTKPFSTNIKMFEIDIRKYKAFLNNKNNIKNIILGSSTARDGFLPDKKSFNFGLSSQDLYHSYYLYNYCSNKTKTIKNIVLFFDVFSSGLQLEKTSEAYKSIIYNLLYDIPYAYKIDRKYNKFKLKLAKYTKNMLKINDDLSLYRGKSYYDNVDNIVDVKELVNKHLKNAYRNNNQIDYLYKLYNETKQNNQNLYIVLPPYRHDYFDCLPDKKSFLKDLYNFIKKNKNVKVLDFMKENLFQFNDFSDCHHLNEKGAKKLTKLIMNNLK